MQQILGFWGLQLWGFLQLWRKLLLGQLVLGWGRGKVKDLVDELLVVVTSGQDSLLCHEMSWTRL